MTQMRLVLGVAFKAEAANPEKLGAHPKPPQRSTPFE